MCRELVIPQHALPSQRVRILQGFSIQLQRSGIAQQHFQDQIAQTVVPQRAAVHADTSQIAQRRPPPIHRMSSTRPHQFPHRGSIVLQGRSPILRCQTPESIRPCRDQPRLCQRRQLPTQCIPGYSSKAASTQRQYCTSRPLAHTETSVPRGQQSMQRPAEVVQ